MSLEERAEKIKQLLEMLETVKLDEAKLDKVEHYLSQIMNELEEAINAGELPDLHLLYEQKALMTKIQSILEDFRELTVKLKEFKKKLESFE
jgi:hypothetical protein